MVCSMLVRLWSNLYTRCTQAIVAHVNGRAVCAHHLDHERAAHTQETQE